MAWCTAGFDIIYGCCGCEAGAGVVLAALIAVKQYYTKYSLTNNDNSRFQSFWAVYAISRLQVGVFFSGRGQNHDVDGQQMPGGCTTMHILVEMA